MEIKVTPIVMSCVHGNKFKFSFTNVLDRSRILSDQCYLEAIKELQTKVLSEEECCRLHDSEQQKEMAEKYREAVKVSALN